MTVRTTALVAAVSTLLLAAGCSDDGGEEKQDSVAPAPVEVSVEAPTPDPVKVGVIATLSERPGQGSDVLPAAEGAQVAAYRLELGGQEVDLVVADDAGTEEGARAAVEELVNGRVSAIVAATTGDHVLPALADAESADVAVLLPYLRTRESLPANAWVTGPSADQVGSALSAAMEATGAAAPFVVSGDDVEVPGVDAAGSASYVPGGTGTLVREIRSQVRQGGADSVLVAASAASQADVVAQLQGQVSNVPVFLTPEALSPVFGQRLTEAGGTVAGQFVTVGEDSTDATTLTAGDRADAVASYFSALRLLSDDESNDLFGSVPFADVAAGADTLSHDAVMAVVAAAAEAGSTDAADVLAALDGLTLGADNGLAGPALDFSDSTALADGSVVQLQATTQDPGVRPDVAATHLFWFAVPAGTTSG